MPKLKSGELFAGVGGLAMAVELAPQSWRVGDVRAADSLPGRARIRGRELRDEEERRSRLPHMQKSQEACMVRKQEGERGELTRECITNDLGRVPGADRPRPCIQKTYDEEKGRWVPAHYAVCAEPSCRGCVAREAEPGTFTCRACRVKIEDALSRAANLLAHLRSVDSSGQAIGERVFTSMQQRLVVPDSFLAADGLLDALGSAPLPSTVDMRYDSHVDYVFRVAQAAVGEWADLDAILATREGSKRGVVLVKRMQTALARFPDAEVDWRHIPLMLCIRCGQATLHRQGPLEARDEILVRCAGSNLLYEQGIGYDQCEFAMDFFEWLDIYSKPIEAAFNIHMKGAA